jgi:hypothetical protein
MVEAAPQLVDGFASNKGKVHGQLGANLNPKDALVGLGVVLTQESVWLYFAEGLNPSFKVGDVEFGPFDFRKDPG